MNILWLKRQAEIVSSIGVLLGAVSAVVIVFGGSVPPWYTPAQAQTDQRNVSKIQADTVTALGKINDKIDKVSRRLDETDCNRLIAALDQAEVALVKKADDNVARTLRDSSRAQMRQIPGCSP